MSLDEIISTTERIGDLDDRRRETFREELEKVERDELDGFPETRELLRREMEALQQLETELENERTEIEDLDEFSEFLSVDQAVEHREKSLEKLRAHNRALQRYHDSMVAGLRIVARNLDIAEDEGLDAVSDIPEEQFDAAATALEKHNDAVDGLKRNLTILNAYLR